MPAKSRGSQPLALWLAHLPGTTLLPMHLEFQATTEGGTFTGWHEALGDRWPEGASLILLGEPFSFPADVLLSRLNDDRPELCVVGGMASGGWGVGQNRLLLGDRVLDRGAVAVVMHGSTKLRTIVSQGCRPVGRPLVVTKAEQNVHPRAGRHCRRLSSCRKSSARSRRTSRGCFATGCTWAR